MASDPLAAYRPTWMCRLFGHAEALERSYIYGKHNTRLGYCERCFLPTSAKLSEDMESFRELLKQQQAMEDLRRMTNGSP